LVPKANGFGTACHAVSDLEKRGAFAGLWILGAPPELEIRNFLRSNAYKTLSSLTKLYRMLRGSVLKSNYCAGNSE
jgi:hypothetical protein